MKPKLIVTYLLLTYIILISFGFSSMYPLQRIRVKLFVSPTNEKLTLKIFSEKKSLQNYQFKIFNLNGKEIKLINLPNTNNGAEIIISIEDLKIGEYSYNIIQDNKRLFKGSFVKDWFDSDLLY
jgi:hypothetical protein